MLITKELSHCHQKNVEIKPNFTSEEFLLWLTPFTRGQKLFNKHIKNSNSVTPVHLCPSYNGKENIISYIEEKDIIIVTFQKIEKAINSIKKYKTENIYKSSNAHLIRLGVSTTPDLMPVFTGIEESAHAHFHKHVKPNLNPNEIFFTKKYDGSDSSEEFAFKQISQIIQTNKSLVSEPLPINFQEKLQLITF